MRAHDLANTLSAAILLQGSFTTTQTPSNGLDMQGKVNPTYLVAVSGMSGSPIDEWEFTLEESDDINANFTAVAGVDMVTSPNCVQPGSITGGKFVEVLPANDDAVFRVTYKGVKRYTRVVATAVNSPTSTPITILLLSQPTISPAAA